MKTLTTPELQPSIDKVEITEWLASPGTKTLRLVLSKGYMDGAAFVVKSAMPVVIAGDDYDAIFDHLGDSAKSIKEALLDEVWAYLVAKGIVTVS